MIRELVHYLAGVAVKTACLAATLILIFGLAYAIAAIGNGEWRF